MLVRPGSGRIGIDSLEGYKLKDSSPCISAGIPIANNGGRDFWGNKLPEDKNPDIGTHNK